MTESTIKCALVIGGCRGIGRAISLRLARDNFDVIATARSESADSRSLQAEIEQMGRKFTLLCFDVTDREKIAAEYEKIFSTSAPDAVIYNAGIAQDNLFIFMDGNEWKSVIDVNVNGFYNTIQPLIFNMVGRKSGRIVVVSSISGQAGQAGQVNYSASKAALIGAVKALAREVGRKGILVNAVAPGVIDTEMIKDIPLDKVLPLIPLNKVGKPDDVAGAVSFLLSPDANYIQGQVIAVNGGLYI